ncbi:MAG TPA: helix-turn-helix domain-containing protein [Limnobacter sp.]|nr:helix-turn-helix domain-containing protein [Limnobacter sp.]
MDISQVSKQSGVPASALRYYEKMGLIQAFSEKGERRKFAPSVFDRLALIALGQGAGFSLEEIRSMLTPNGPPDIDRALLASKAEELDAKVRRLKAISKGLRHAAQCPATNHAACPSFQKLLKSAASGALEKRWGKPSLF